MIFFIEMMKKRERQCFRLEFKGDNTKKATLSAKWELVKRHMQHISHDKLHNFDVLLSLLKFYLEKFRDRRKCLYSR